MQGPMASSPGCPEIARSWSTNAAATAGEVPGPVHAARTDIHPPDGATRRQAAGNTDHREDGNDFYARHAHPPRIQGSGVRCGSGLAEGFRLDGPISCAEMITASPCATSPRPPKGSADRGRKKTLLSRGRSRCTAIRRPSIINARPFGFTWKSAIENAAGAAWASVRLNTACR